MNEDDAASSVVIVCLVFTPCVGECSRNLVWTVMYLSSLLCTFDCLKLVCVSTIPHFVRDVF